MAEQEFQDLHGSVMDQARSTNNVSTASWETLQFLPRSPPRITEYDSPNVGKTNPKHQQQLPGIWRQWWAEILNAVLMIGSLCGMVAVLYQNQDKPLPNLPFEISINAVVSILSTVLKASAGLILAEGISDLKWKWFRTNRSLNDLAVFDMASRGPWGCLRLLIRPRGTHLIASLGAALIILILAMDPFTQQLIRFYDCKIVSTTTSATLPRAMLYSEVGQHLQPGSWPPATPVLGVIDQGLYNPSTIKTPFICVTGNCTFDDIYSTLGFCSTCEDMTSQLRIFNFSNGYNTWRTRTGETGSEPKIMVNATLPSGSYTSIDPASGDISNGWFRMNATSDGWIDVIQASYARPGGAEDWRADHHLATTVRPFRGCNTAFDNNTWACSGFGGSGAARCKIEPCVRSHNAAVTQGDLTETLVKRPAQMYKAEWEAWSAADVTCAGSEAVSQLQNAGFSIANDDIIIPWNVLVNQSDGTASIYVGSHGDSFSNVTVPGPPLINTSLPLDIIPANCLYQMTHPAGSSILDYIGDYFAGDVFPAANDVGIFGSPQLLTAFNNTYANFDSIKAIFDGMAEALTLRVRTYNNSDSPEFQPASGKVFIEQTCVSVRWPYLVFPIAVVVLTTVFLTTIVGYAALGKAGAVAAGWKSSILPLTFHGLTIDRSGSESVDGNVAGISSLDTMESMARSTVARVTDSSNVD